MLHLSACDEAAHRGHVLHDEVTGDVSGALVQDAVARVAAAVPLPPTRNTRPDLPVLAEAVQHTAPEGAVGGEEVGVLILDDVASRDHVHDFISR